MKSIAIAQLSLLCLAASTAVCAAADFEVRNEAEFRKIFPEDAKVTKLAGGFGFTEGPVWISRDGGYLVFSDIRKNQLKKWTTKDGITTFREPSRNANGNTLDRHGRLVTAEHSGRRVSLLEQDGSVVTVVDRFDGKKFNSPNDVVVKSDGTYWFTDPPYGLPQGEEKEQAGNYVFRHEPATKTTTVLVQDFDMPNGLCFSPDEKKLYVADSGKPHHIRVFDVARDGTVSNGRVFAVIEKGGPDGIRCDPNGRVWSSSGNGADVFAPDGSLIAKINLPEAGANLCFGGKDGTTLFITAREGLYAVETKTTLSVNGAVSGLSLVTALAQSAVHSEPATPAPLSPPSIDGTYELTERVMANGTVLRPPSIVALYTMVDGRLSLNLFVKHADGTVASESTVGRYTFSADKYCEWIVSTIRNNLDKPGVTNEAPAVTDHCTPVTSKAGRFSFSPPGEGVEVSFGAEGFTAKIGGKFVDHWRKIR